MTDSKPKLITIAGRPVAVADRVAEARKKHGKKFAHEPGSTWVKHATPLLTAWMQRRGKT